MNEQQEGITSPFHRRSVQITLSGIVLLVMGSVAGYDRWFGNGKHHANADNASHTIRESLLDDASPAGLALTIDLNQATIRELTLLPGIGTVLAQRILADRRNNGRFHSIEDLGRVPGIGPKTIQEIRSICFVAEESTLEGSDEVTKHASSDQHKSHGDD